VSGACLRPIADDAFLEWWAGEPAAAERRRLEEHLLACDECAARLRVAGAIADGVRALVRHGRVPAVLTAGAPERLRREGLKVREYRVARGGGVACTVSPEDDALVARLELPPVGAARVDLLSRLDDGEEDRLSDLPLAPSAAELILAAPIDVIRSLPAHVLVLRLVAVGPEGDRPLGEYTFRHTPWPGSEATD
jgi:hypothetical protein